MAWVDYEEKSYETGANVELALGGAGREVWSPGQVGEAILGYDVAANLPASSQVWELVGALPPSGVVLAPSFWLRRPVQPPPVELPSSPVSLVLQYKRPQLLSTANANQWHHWGKPYFRIDVTDPDGQRDTLLEIEKAVASLAVVRYAAPAIGSLAELRAAQQSGKILERSNFVSPATIGPPHEVWTYVQPGTAGFVNAEGKEIRHESVEQFRDHVRPSREAKGDSILAHLRKLASALQPDGAEFGLSDESRAGLIEAFPHLHNQPAHVQGIADLFAVGNTLSVTESAWFISTS